MEGAGIGGRGQGEGGMARGQVSSPPADHTQGRLSPGQRALYKGSTNFLLSTVYRISGDGRAGSVLPGRGRFLPPAAPCPEGAAGRGEEMNVRVPPCRVERH